MAAASPPTAPVSDPAACSDVYKQLLAKAHAGDTTADRELISSFKTLFQGAFSFDDLEDITDENNILVSGYLLQLLDCEADELNKELEADILSCLKLITRTRKGLDLVLSQSGHNSFINSLRRGIDNTCSPVIAGALSCLINSCILDQDGSFERFHELETFEIIVGLILDSSDVMDDNTLFYTLRLLFYILLHKPIATVLYERQSFFDSLFRVFLEKTRTEGSDDQLFWNQTQHCQIAAEILKIMFNFTLVKNDTLDVRLNETNRDVGRAVVGRAVQILLIPLEAQRNPPFNMEDPISTTAPCLTSVKLTLVDALLYTSKILATQIPDAPDFADRLFDLFEYKARHTRKDYKTKQTLVPMLSLMKEVVTVKKNIRQQVKVRIFKDDADSKARANPESDVPMDPLRDPDPAPGECPTMRNMMLDYCTSVNYALKRSVGEFLFAVCGEDTKEFTRLCGLGNAIGTLVDKGLPGFAGMADNAMDLNKLAELKRMKERADAQAANEESDDDDDDDEPESSTANESTPLVQEKPSENGSK